jgi:MFS family permease
MGERRAEGPSGFWAVAAALTVTMVGTTLPTPLYPALQRRLGFDDLTITVLFAIYAGGVLLALVFLGRVSDLIGPRPVLMAGLGAAAFSALAFLSGTGLTGLLIGRLLSGLSAGMVTGTATVALAELEPPGNHGRAALVATASNTLGLGCGPLLSGLLAELGLFPLVAPFVVHLALVIVVGAGLWLAPELKSPRSMPTRALSRFRIDWPTLPREARPVFPAVAVGMFACFAMLGLVAAVEPAFLTRLLNVTSPLLSGGVVFAMFAGSALSQVATRRLRAASALVAGCAIVLVAVFGFATALFIGSAALIVFSTMVIGIGQGLAFRAAVAISSARSPGDERSGTMSSFFLVVYLGISVPVVAAGYAADATGLRTAGIGFTAAVAALLLTALITTTRARIGEIQ